MNYKEVAIVICSYKNRTDVLFKHLNSIKDFDIYIAVRDYDYIESGYDKYEFNDNIKFLYLKDVTNIANTRYAATEQVLDLGYKGMIMIDDDIEGYVLYTTDSEKRTTSDAYKPKKKSIEDTCKYMVDKANEYDAGVVGINFSGHVHWQKPNSIRVNKHISWGAFVFINLDLCRKYNIRHEKNVDLFEDMDVAMQFLLNGITCIMLADHGMVTKISYNSVVGDNNRRYLMGINLYLKYRDYVKFYLHRNQKDLRVKLNYNVIFDGYKNYGKQYIIDDPMHNKLYELAKEHDVDGIVNLLKNPIKNESKRSRRNKS